VARFGVLSYEMLVIVCDLFEVKLLMSFFIHVLVLLSSDDTAVGSCCLVYQIVSSDSVIFLHWECIYPSLTTLTCRCAEFVRFLLGLCI
jgi:hypothetical protein